MLTGTRYRMYHLAVGEVAINCLKSDLSQMKIQATSQQGLPEQPYLKSSEFPLVSSTEVEHDLSSPFTKVA